MAALGRGEWLKAAVEELADGGLGAVRVEVLARRLGVTKGSFYWHFEGRDDLLDAVLAWYETAGTEEIIERADAAAPDAEARLRVLAGIVFAPSGISDRAEPAIRAWASSDPRAAETLQRVDRRRIGYVTDLLTEIGLRRPVARRRAEIFYRALIGEFVWRAHGGRPLSRTARAEIVDLLIG